MTDHQIEILTGKRCPYCNIKTQHVDSRLVYGTHISRYRPPTKVYMCPKCHSYVGCHKDNQIKALGRVSNKTLRELKIKTHEVFDPLWKKLLDRCKHSRNLCYDWLSEEMDIEREYCHIGMFDEYQCKQVIEICQSPSSLIRWIEFYQYKI